MNIYQSGIYLDENPGWHEEDSPWKAKQILGMLDRHELPISTICEVGCGAGEILKQLQNKLDGDHNFYGYDISPQAYELCSKKSNDKLIYYLKDFTKEDCYYNLLLIMDVVEHIEDYFNFLRSIRIRGQYKIFQFPLDMNALNIIVHRLISTMRNKYGHIHYFTKEIALEILKDTGYEVIDYFYTRSFDLDSPKTLTASVYRATQKGLFAINKDLAARLIGGPSLLVLAK
jgi:hypothetical protein